MLDLSGITFLNTVSGLSYCCDDVGVYEDILMTYVMEPRREGLDEAFRKKDWKSYQTQVHALKSASKMIGADRLSDDAAQLEAAARDGDIDRILGGHAALMQEYSALIEQMQQVLADCASVDDIELWDGSEDDMDSDEAVSGEDSTDSRSIPLFGISSDQAAVSIDSQKKEVRRKMQSVDISGSYILVVDDDDINIQIAKNMLCPRFRVGAVNCGEDVLSSIEKEVPDLILLDVHMKGMSGHDVIRQLKDTKEYCDIPIIFLTADNDDEAEIQGFNEGAMDYIRKPFRREIALRRIDRILELSYLQNYLLSEVDKQTRKAEERREAVERLSLMIVKALANTIDAKDKYTKGHSSRVSEYSGMLAKKMGFAEEDIQNLQYIALLHDLGKIGVPDQIINKPGKLTDEEFSTIKTHPVIGSRILQDITEFPNIAIGARWHHERYDGRGYPDGLVGDDIPLVARIIAVADAYDAMASKRSYRDVLPQAVIRAEIEKGLGTQFDPQIGQLMLDIIDEDSDYKLHE